VSQRKVMMRKDITYLVVLALLPIIMGCAGTRPSQVEIGWPPPPQEPKIIYVETITGSADLSRGLFGSIKDFLFGKPEDKRIGKPYGVKRDRRERLYIADTARKGILVIDRRAGGITFFSSLGAYGSLGEPVYVILDDAGNVYVSDTKLGKVGMQQMTQSMKTAGLRDAFGNANQKMKDRFRREE